MEKWFEWRGEKKQVYTGLMNKNSGSGFVRV